VWEGWGQVCVVGEAGCRYPPVAGQTYVSAAEGAYHGGTHRQPLLHRVRYRAAECSLMPIRQNPTTSSRSNGKPRGCQAYAAGEIMSAGVFRRAVRLPACPSTRQPPPVAELRVCRQAGCSPARCRSATVILQPRAHTKRVAPDAVSAADSSRVTSPVLSRPPIGWYKMLQETQCFHVMGTPNFISSSTVVGERMAQFQPCLR